MARPKKNNKRTAPRPASARPAKKMKIAAMRLENGLVSMKETPQHLVAIVNLNASRSPLLKLPGELRNKIWELAMGGTYIEVTGDYDTNPKGNAILNPTWPEYVPLSAFHLPEVCRQIYSETAVLAYKLNIFVIGIGIGRSNKKWIKKLLPAQRDAITAIAPTDEFLDDYICQFMEVTASALRRVMCYGRACRGTYDFETPEEWQDLVLGRIQEKEGEDIEIEFGEPVEIPKLTRSSDDDSDADFFSDDDDDGDGELRMTLEDMVADDVNHEDDDWMDEEVELSEDPDEEVEDEPEDELLP